MKKKELAQSEAEVTKTMEAVAKLQKRLQEAEKSLVRETNNTMPFLLHCYIGGQFISSQRTVKIS